MIWDMWFLISRDTMLKVVVRDCSKVTIGMRLEGIVLKMLKDSRGKNQGANELLDLAYGEQLA
jgi:hypothetical protein